jgi:hypothetical protein
MHDTDVNPFPLRREPGRSPSSGTPTRRTVLVAGGSAVVGAAVGVTLGLRGDSAAPPSPQQVRRDRAAIRDLEAAIDAERTLAAQALAVRRSASDSVRETLDEVHADHVAHLRALQGVLEQVRFPNGKPAASASAGSSPVTESPAAPSGAVSVGELRRAELRATSAATARAGRLTGPAAVLLASIAASESCHAEALA